jgi:hypothetical protein
MEAIENQFDILIKELMVVLDNDAANIEMTLDRLDMLRAAVIKRDQEGLKVLLGTISSEEDVYSQFETRRYGVRSMIASCLGWEIERVNISNLKRVVSEDVGVLLGEKQVRLKELTSKLRKEHEGTSALLRECARLNKILLRSILNNGKETLTYNNRGAAAWESRRRLVSFRS